MNERKIGRERRSAEREKVLNVDGKIKTHI